MQFFANIKAATFDYKVCPIDDLCYSWCWAAWAAFRGSIIAAIVLTALPEAMREFADYRMLLYAIVLIIVMLTTYNPTMRNFFQRLRRQSSCAVPERKNEKSLQKEGA